MIFKRILHRQARAVAAPVNGGEPGPTLDEQKAMRASMEADMSADRSRRGATDARPGETPHPR